MKHISQFFAFLVVFASSIFVARAEVGKDNIDFGKLNVAGTEFDFVCDWIYSGSEQISSALNRDFILRDGLIYINNHKKSPAYDFVIVDAATGAYKDKLTLDWPGKTAKRHSVFVGHDTSGNYFCSTEGNSTTAFELARLSFDASGKPSVNELFTLPIQSDWNIRSVDVEGDLAAGNFTVFATIWKAAALLLNTSTETGLAVWNVVGGKVGSPQFVSKSLTVTDIEPLGNNKFIIVSRGPINDKDHCDYRTPTLCKWIPSTGEIIDIEPFTGKMFTNCTAAAEVFSLANKQFMVYWNWTGTLGAPENREGSHFGLAYVPGIPDSFNATNIVENFGIGNANKDKKYTDCDWPWTAHSAAHVEKISDKAARIVIIDHGGNLRSYTLSTENAGLPEIEKVAPTFTPASGSKIKKGDAVTIACEGALTILYKLDGGEATVYVDGIVPDADCTIEAWGVYADGEGPHATATYTVEQPIVKVAPIFTPESGSKIKKGDAITIACEGALTILYKLDGGATTTYKDGIVPEADCTIEAWGYYADGEGPHATATYTVEQPIVKVAPTFTPASGSKIKKGDAVTIACEGALTILYKLDGGAATVYKDGIVPEADCNIEAWGVYADGEGLHATATYTVEQPIVKVAPTFTPASGSMIKKGDAVTISCEGALTIFYKLDGGDATVYVDGIVPEADCTIEAWGYYADGEGPHATATYTVEQPIAKVAPTFTPASGSKIKKGDAVTIACEGALTILYKLDGGDATVYKDGIVPEADCTIEAWGYYVDGEGPHATATYTVEQPIVKVAPTFTPASGSKIKKGDAVTISCEGALTILYKLDGGDNLQYVGGIVPKSDCTIEAWGVYAGGEGPHATATYTVEQPIAKVAPTFTPASGSKIKKGDAVTIACEGALTILYKLDGGDNLQYVGGIVPKSDCTIEAWGVYADGEGPHATATYTVEEPIVKVAPTFTPASGTKIKKGDAITIACEDALTILYKLDGGNATVYKDGIVPEADCTIEAWGVYADGEGPHATATYTVEQPIAKVAPTFTPASGSKIKKGDAVTISCEGALTILYKLDGGAATVYKDGIVPEADCTIEAWGYYVDGEGPHATATYTVEQPIVKVAPTFTPASGSKIKKGDKVTIECEGALIILYKLDGATAKQYIDGVYPEQNCRIEAWGVYADGEGPHVTAKYTVDRNLVMKEPVFNPASGTTLKPGDKVTITCEEATLVLYRINNGSVTPYIFDPVTIENDCEIEAWGIYPEGDGPHATAKYYVESDKSDCYLATTSLSDVASGMQIKIAALCDGMLYGAMPCGISGISGEELTAKSLSMSATSKTGTYILDACNRGGYTIRENSSGNYLRLVSNGEFILSSYDTAEQFYISYETRNNVIYTVISDKEGDKTLYYDVEKAQFVMASKVESNILVYRYSASGKPKVPDNVYLHYNFGDGWNFANPVNVVASDNGIITLDRLGVPSDKVAELFFANRKSEQETESSDWLDVTKGIIYAPSGDIFEVENGYAIGMTAYPEGQFIGTNVPVGTVPGGYTYSFQIEFGGYSPILHITKTSGTTTVDEIDSNDAEPEYYNLQGIRVEHPAHGVYIERRGNAVRKVYIR